MIAFRASIRRRGFSWVEVLAVLVILAVLAALMLPAVEQAREAARRTQCKNNLKQIGLALHNYHDTVNTFPFGYLLDINGPYRGWGWQVFVLPYIDCSPIYNGIDFNGGLQYEYSSPDLNHTLAVYRCPSDDGSPLINHAFVARTNVYDGLVTAGLTDAVDTFHRSNYFGVVGYLQADVGGIEFDANGTAPASEPFVNAGSLGNIGSTFSPEHRYCDQQNFRGIFGQNSWVKIDDITDGTSNVIMVGERYTPKAVAAGSIGHGTWIGVPDCSTPEGLAMSLGDTSLKINAGYRTRAQTTGFGSEHVGGMHFLLGDGSVRFLSDQTNVGMLRNLSTIDDKREVGDF